MDEELKNEFLKNSKLLGIMTKEQPQSPDDMMCLLDMYVDIYIRNKQFFSPSSTNKILNNQIKTTGFTGITYGDSLNKTILKILIR